MTLQTAYTRAQEYLRDIFITDDSTQLPPLLQATHAINKRLIETNFNNAPAARTHHHNYPGGLLIHTAEVVYIALSMYESITHEDEDELDMFAIIALAALWHDSAKMNEYDLEGRNEDGTWDYSDTVYKDLVHHVSGSYGSLMYALGSTGVLLDNETSIAVSHCMLAHHGRREWGSPVPPQTPLAHIVHMADVLSCEMGYVEENFVTPLSLYDLEESTGLNE